MSEKPPPGYPTPGGSVATVASSSYGPGPTPYQGPPPSAGEHNSLQPTGVVPGQPVPGAPAGGYVPNAGLPVLPDGNLVLGTSRRVPMQFVCSKCGFTGLSSTEKNVGAAAWMATMLTLGLALNKLGRDVVHSCPQCQEVLGVSKLM